MRPMAGSASCCCRWVSASPIPRRGVAVPVPSVSLPFVVRTLQPVLGDLDREVERAAETLGASRFQSFIWVVLPSIWPTLLTGVALGFSRAVGEYGSGVFFAGHLSMGSENA